MFNTSATLNTRSGVPIKYRFSLNGNMLEDIGYADTLYSMSDISCKSEPVDGKFSVSELTVTFIDVNGSLWAEMGKGTSNLNANFAATAFLGGTVDYSAYQPTDSNGSVMLRMQPVSGTSSGQAYPLHTGNIYEVSRRGRLTTLVSKSKMRKVADLEWRFPVGSETIANSRYTALGTCLFFSEDLTRTSKDALSKLTPEGEFETYVYIASGATEPSLYGTVSGRGTLGLNGSGGFMYPGTQFYFDYTRYQFKGSFLGYYSGSLIGSYTNAADEVENEIKAKFYGFASPALARAAVGTFNGELLTPINKTRLAPIGTNPSFLSTSKYVFQQGEFTLNETPARLWYELLTGNCVTPYFSGTDIDSVAYGSALKITAYQNYKTTIDPKGGKVLPFIKSLLEPLQARFSVSQANTLRAHFFGPRNLAEASGTITEGEVLDSFVSSNLDDKINRVSLSYAYDYPTGSYARQLEIRGTGWSYAEDYPLELESPWILTDNDASITVKRLLTRYSNGVPRLELTVPLSQVGLDVGSLVTVTDADLGYSGKEFEVTGWSKDFDKERNVSLSLLDANALYRQRGYARWEDATSLTATVSGTSTSGWGTNGTVANINVPVYGQRFVWF